MTATSTWGTATFKISRWRMQIYWPYLRYRRVPGQRNFKEVITSADTVFRMAAENHYFGLGIQVLGFGIAADYYQPKEP